MVIEKYKLNLRNNSLRIYVQYISICKSYE